MGRARRQNRRNRIHIIDPVIAEELKEAGLPMSFETTKGQHIEGQQNVEAARVGQIRRYQQFQNKKLKLWQKKRLRGIKLRKK